MSPTFNVIGGGAGAVWENAATANAKTNKNAINDFLMIDLENERVRSRTPRTQNIPRFHVNAKPSAVN
jgi:hypothetical protein